MPYNNPGYITIERDVWEQYNSSREEQGQTWSEFMAELHKIYLRETDGD